MNWMKSKSKEIFFILKIVITSFILYFVFRKLDFNALLINFSHLNLLVIMIILVTTVLKFYTQLKNWELFLGVNPHYKPESKEIMISHFVGLALRFFIPGGSAIVGKIFYVENRKKLTLLSLGLEVFFQTWIILLFASVSCFFFFENISKLVITIAFVLILILPLSAWFFEGFLKKDHHKLYLKQYLNFIPKVMPIQFIYIFLTIFQYYIILKTLSGFTLWKAVIAVPLILSSNTIPITYSGLGLRETFAVNVLGKYGIDPHIAVTTSLTIFFFNAVLPAIIGVFFIFRNKKVMTRTEVKNDPEKGNDFRGSR